MSRVAIIGAGPSGLAQLHAFEQARRSGAGLPEIVCFEKQDDWGGLWNYTWRTGLDQHGEPVHGSMYRYLWSNGPKECLEFADYSFDEHFGRPIPSFPPREVLYDYIIGRARSSGIRRHIRFGTTVRRLSFDTDADSFELVSESLADGAVNVEHFSDVVVATGHFSTPNMPEYPGFAGFPGRISHSHDFRDPHEFSGADVLLLGSGYSAEDLALQSMKYGARSVTISYRTSPMGFGWPEGIREVPGLLGMEGRRAHFADGSSAEFDAIVLCTGYRHHFPFVDDALRLRTDNNLYPPGLYKGVFWKDNPRLAYLGMQDQFYTFTMFDAQARYARDVILGRSTLPPPAEMDADISAWRARLAELTDAVDQIGFQTDYIRDLLSHSDYPEFDLELARQHFVAWEDHKLASITGYRDQSFVSACTGTQAAPHHTKWWEEMDDGLENFLNSDR